MAVLSSALDEHFRRCCCDGHWHMIKKKGSQRPHICRRFVHEKQCNSFCFGENEMPGQQLGTCVCRHGRWHQGESEMGTDERHERNVCTWGHSNLWKWKTQVESFHVVSHAQRTETSPTMDSHHLCHTCQWALCGSHNAVLTVSSSRRSCQV